MEQNSPQKTKQHSPWIILATVMVGTLLIGLDSTVVNLGLAKMMSDFGVSVSTASWISIAYIISNAVFIPVFGKLGDKIGNRKIYLYSFIGFIFISILCGLAWNISSMIFFRILQGLVGAAISPTAMSLIAKNFTDQKTRAQALGIWSASFAAAMVIGPLIGGPIIDNYSWRMLFYINLPVGIIGILMVLLFLPNDEGKEKGGFDFYGSITLAIALSSLVLVLEKGQDWGWTSNTSLLAYLITIIFGIWFVQIEKKHPYPMIDLKFFKNQTFVSALAVSFVSFGGMMGAMFLIPVFAQTYLGFDATQTGLLFLPMSLTMFVAAPIGAKLSQKIHVRYCVFLGMLTTAFAISLFTKLDPKTSTSDLILPLMTLATGMGMAMSPLTNTVASSVPAHEVGMASAVLSLIRSIAGAMGIALFGTLLNNAIKTNVLELGANAIINNSTYNSLVASLVILRATVLAYREVFLVSSIIVATGAFIGLTLKDRTKIKDESEDIKIIAEA
jgi:EmrB/QacA subfamily drug resistance transporter